MTACGRVGGLRLRMPEHVRACPASVSDTQSDKAGQIYVLNGVTCNSTASTASDSCVWIDHLIRDLSDQQFSSIRKLELRRINDSINGNKLWIVLLLRVASTCTVTYRFHCQLESRCYMIRNAIPLYWPATSTNAQKMVPCLSLSLFRRRTIRSPGDTVCWKTGSSSNSDRRISILFSSKWNNFMMSFIF